MTEKEKIAVFQEILDTFETNEMRKYCEDMIKTISDYIFTIPSSTSMKYHNATQCQPHGQVYHIIMFAAIMNYRLALRCNKQKFNSPKIRDAMRCIPIFHDAVKCGWHGSQYTVHEHPMLAGVWVRENKVEHDIDDETKEVIARMCERHSGEWTSSKRSQVVLPEPETEAEIFCHECDILSSRSDIDMRPSAYLKSIFGDDSTNLPDINTYTLNFGKMKGLTIPQIADKDISYLYWAKENMTRQPEATLIKNYLNNKGE